MSSRQIALRLCCSVLLASGASAASDPWAEPLLLDANLGLPVLDLDTLDFKVSADLSLGYQWAHTGVLGRFAVHAYDQRTDTQIADTTFPRGEIQVFHSGRIGKRWRWEGRAEAGLAAYDTTVIPIDGGSTVFADEDSLLWRGSVWAGARYAHGHSAFGLWLGGGYEREDYSSLTVTRAAKVEQLEKTRAGSTQSLRLRAQTAVIANTLDVRLRVDALRHHLTRANLNVLFSERAVVESTQTDLGARIHLDWVTFRLLGFVPSIGGGLDVHSLDQQGGASTTVVPQVSVGVRQTLF